MLIGVSDNGRGTERVSVGLDVIGVPGRAAVPSGSSVCELSLSVLLVGEWLNCGVLGSITSLLVGGSVGCSDSGSSADLSGDWP